MTWHPDGDPYFHRPAPDRPVVVPVAEVERMWREILDDRRDPIDRRVFADQVARVRDPIAYERRQRDIETLRAERLADQKTTVTCAQCGATVPWDITKKPSTGMDTTCPNCHGELGVDTSDDSMYEPARLPETVPLRQALAAVWALPADERRALIAAAPDPAELRAALAAAR